MDNNNNTVLSNDEKQKETLYNYVLIVPYKSNNTSIIFDWDEPFKIWNRTYEQDNNFNNEPTAAMTSVKIKFILIFPKNFIFIKLVNRLRPRIVMLVLEH